jgi:hypothetical protein
MRRLEVYIADQVGDGPGYLEHPVKDSCAQAKLSYGTPQQLSARIVKLAEFVSFARTHISVKRTRWHRRSVDAGVRGSMPGSDLVIKVLPAPGGPLNNKGGTSGGCIRGLCLPG